MSKSSERKATQLLMLRPYKTVIHNSQPCYHDNRVHFCSSFLQSVVEGEIDPQNNRYWSSQNPDLTHDVPLHQVKVGVWRAVSARIVVPVFSNETINCERYLHVEGRHFKHLLRSVNCNYFIQNVIGRQARSFIDKIRMRLAGGSAQFTAKRRAVEWVNKVKIFPVLSCIKRPYNFYSVTSLIE
jgi:hypothetical protein